jgi:feruloyl-CoA synthase
MAQYRDFSFGITRGLREERDGHSYLRAEPPLAAFPERMTDRLAHWAKERPDQIWMARRPQAHLGQDSALDGPWITITYAQAWDLAQRIGQALLDRGLNAERPLAILSENSLEHALLALGAMTVGVPYCPVSSAYSLLSQDYDKLRHVLTTITPGLVYASDWSKYGKAIEAAAPVDVEVAISSIAKNTDITRAITPFSALTETNITPAVQAAMQATNSDSIVKFLFTSGSTKLPKAVINTQRMICANQQQMAQASPDAFCEPPVLVDWLPWNHTFGGNHNFYIVLYHGGTMYINDGKPVPALIGETIRNLREISPTVYYDVPVGFELLANAMKSDTALRKSLLKRVRMFFYAGAALSQPVWDSLYDSEEQELGQRIVMASGLGMTESAPFGLFVTSPHVRAGDLGLPAPGLELKLVRLGDKVEVRYRGPNITPGYWRNPEATQESFDDEGFFCTGDAVTWIDESDFHKGLKFDGRVAEDFKLATGTFVSVGPLRARIIAAGAPYVQDAVITGLNLKEIGALIFPTPRVRDLAASDGVAADAPLSSVLQSPSVQQHFQNVLNQLAQTATGSATRVARMHLLHEPASIDRGEVTDKGSINQRAVLTQRDALVRALHEGTLPFSLVPQP